MTILVAYVARPEGRAALAKGIELATRLDERLLVLNASAGTPMDDGSIASSAEISEVERTLADTEIESEFRQLIRGKTPAEEILELADARVVSVAIIGIRKRSAIGKLLLGSVAQEILLSAPCPVLAVKAE